MDDFDRPQIHLGQVLAGGALVALGAAFLLDRMFIIQPWVFALWFPVFLVAFGMTRIVWPSRPGRQIGGMWITLVGGLLLMDQLDIIKMHESWPIFVLMAGLVLVFRALGWLPGREWRHERRWKGVR